MKTRHQDVELNAPIRSIQRKAESARLSSQIHVWAPAFRSFGGGIAAFSRELAIALQDQGHRLELCGRDDLDGRWNDAPVHGAGAVPSLFRKLVFASRLLWLIVRKRPSLVITTHLNFGPVALLAKYFLRVPYVIVAHGVDMHSGLSNARKLALREAGAVWAVSRWTRDRCLQLGLSSERVRVLSNTVDEQRFNLGHDSAALRQRYALLPGEKVLLTVARLDPGEQYKGCDTVLRAIPSLQAKVGPVRYLIAGAGGDRARVEQLASELGVGNRVTFCGFVPDSELPDHYRLADVFVMPSRGEGFGIVFLEAMACGTPVLGGDRDGTVDALVDGVLGALADPEDPAAIAAALQRLLERRGPAVWFDPPALREQCLAIHGRAAFAQRVADALLLLDGVKH